MPSEYSLFQNYPNPFNARTTIKYGLPEAARVIINIYDVLGRRVETLVDTKQQPGYYQVTWNADDLSSGIYFYKLTAGDFVESKKMTLLK